MISPEAYAVNLIHVEYDYYLIGVKIVLSMLQDTWDMYTMDCYLASAISTYM